MVAVAGLAFAPGCETTAVNKDSRTTFLDADDMVAMTNQMAREIVADPRVQAAWANGPLKIVIKPVDNQTNEIMPRGESELFVARLQGLLAKQQSLSDRFVWVINRSDYAKLRAEEIPEERLGASEERIIPEYALWATFYSATEARKKSRSDIYVCHYKLTKISGGVEGATIWLGQHDVSKSIKRNLLD